MPSLIFRAIWSVLLFASLLLPSLVSHTAAAQGVCNRSPAVQAYLLSLFATNDCHAVTDANLASINEDLLIEAVNLTSISANDLNGLTNIDTFVFNNNNLSAVAPNAFAGLTATQIFFTDNPGLTTLPINLLASHVDPSTITEFNVTGTPLATDGWEITNASWQENINGSVTLHLGHSLTTAINVTISSVNGTLSHSNLIIPAGSTSSQSVAWTQTLVGAIPNIQITEDQINDPVLNGFITLPDYTFTGVCDRTIPFPTLLTTAAGKTDCKLVTYLDLGSVSAAQNWSSQSINDITANDLAGLFKLNSINFGQDTLNFSNNNISKLVNGTFSDVQVHTINFSGNNISVIEPTAMVYFGNAPFILDWNFSFNAITSATLASKFIVKSVKPSEFSVNLFNFAFNDITTIQQAYFDGININTLDLSHNQITNFSADTFDTSYRPTASGTVELDLNSNNLTALAENSFSSAAWQTIRLFNNQINSLSNNTFVNTNKLQRLNLSGNQITDFNSSSVDQGNNPTAMNFLLDANPIILKTSNFAGMTIRNLYLRELPTSTIASNTFAGINSLDTIYMSNGSISILATDAFTNAAGLNDLYLDNNLLTNIPSDAFGSGSSLNNLYLQDNQIATIGNSAFAQLTELNLLDLSGNDLTGLSDASFDGLAATNIDLSDNNIATLPLNLLINHTRLESITSIDISGNNLTNNTWEITNASWQENINGSFTLQLGHSLPVDINLDLTSATGTISPSTITIASGSTSSQAVTWTAFNSGGLTNFVVDLNQINVTQLSGYINIPDVVDNGVCNRTIPFPTLLTTAVGKTDCSLVSGLDLESITAAQDWSSQSINDITANDLAGLFKLNSINFGQNTLNFSNNNISKLVNGTFADVQVHTINFSGNNISVIEPTAMVYFGNAPFILDWNFSFNAITSATLASKFIVKSVKPSEFSVNLFNFSFNDITTIQQAYFDGININTLDLSHNQITNFSADTFDTSYRPTASGSVELDLNSNNLTALAENSFSSAAWQTIRLFNNQINSLSNNTFANTNKLQRLNLSGNQITDFNSSSVDQGNNPTAMNFLLDANPIILKTSNFAGMTIRNLYLRELPTSTIASHTFAGINSLDTIYMSNGSISILATDAFTNAAGLNDLYLDNNLLTNIPSDAFGSGSSLTNLYLQDNQIATIGNSAFAQLTELNLLDLSGNNLTSLPIASFDGLAATNIDLSDNNIATLPLNLLINHTQPASITSFDISGNNLTNNTWEITNVSWQENIDGSFTLQLGHSLPVDINLDLTSATGTISPSTITIASGSTSSQAVTWTAFNNGGLVNFVVDLNQINVTQLSGYINIPDVVDNGVCDRTIPFPTLLTTAVGKTDCKLVSDLDLESITAAQDWSSQSINDITANDLAGLFKLNAINFGQNTLNFSNNKISKLVNGTFSDVQVHTINFSGNNISVIEPTAMVYFGNAPFILDWNFSFNAITSATLASKFIVKSVKPSEFSVNLFNFSFNDITTIQQAYFDGININTLDLSHNQITNFSADTFDTSYRPTASGTVELDLNSNNLTALAENSFSSAAWQTIRLFNNQINSLSNNTFANTNKLQRLNLSGNQITDFNSSSVDQGNNPTAMNFLLDANPIILKTSNFAGMTIRNLYLRELPTSTIASNTFAGINSLDTIYMSNGSISILATDAFTNAAGLNDLYLDNNSLTNIPSDAFGSGSSLNKLYLQDNQIATIGNSAFAQLTELNLLDLSGNNLTSLPIASFDGLRATNIDLSDNQISVLPTNLLINHTNPASITNFDVSGNLLTDDSWEITNVSWVEGSSGEFTLQLGHALPADINLNLTSDTGTLNASQITITAGSTSSSAVAWTEGAQVLAHIKPVTAQINVAELSGFVMIPEAGSTFSGICDRTVAVQTAILVALNVSACAEVTYDNLTQYSADILDLTNLGLTTVNDFDIDYLYNVSAFDLSDNSLTNIPNDTFNQVTPSVMINLANNNIAVIAANALMTSTSPDNNVDYNLSNNAITADTLSSGFLTASATHTFVGGSFDLSDNQITTLAVASFADFNPASLYLHNNSIATIEDNALAAATGLQTLNLANNQLATVTESTLSGLSGLITLDLSNNALANMSDNALLDLSSLVTLNLTNNQLSTITAATFNGLAATAIDLSNNNIASLPIDLLLNHTNPAAISAFELSGNTITDWNITTVNWVAGDNNSYTLAIDHALPQDINIDLSSPYDLDANTITISKGETVSTAVQWTPQLSDDTVYIQPLTNVINIAVLAGYIDIPILGIPSVVCTRTEVIRDLLTAALNQTDCTNTTKADLLALTGSLNWGNQNISQLTANDLRDLPGIHTFIKSNNSIVTLVDDLFSSNAPTTIDFSGNAIDTIAVNALRTSVEGDDALDVNLSNNQISTATLASGFLTSPASHTFIGGNFDLSFNQISSLVAASFVDFNPATLHLRNNSIASIQASTFSSMSGLQVLNLANNQLATVTESTLSGLSGLITLDLSNNALANMSDNALLDLSALISLNVADNQLTNIPAAMFSGSAVTDIDLSNNNIAALPINLLINHTNPAAITAFDLSGNTITDWNITTVNWVAGDNNSYTLAIDHALPQDINIDLSSPYDLDTNTITISKGETVSTAVQWTPQLSDDEVYIQPLTNVINITVLGGYIDIPILGIPSVVCMRTEVIRDLLTAALNQTDCTNTTKADLLALTGSLNWGNQNISQLTALDLQDLAGIDTFIKSNNSIVTLVDDLFSSNAPTTIDFSGNAIDTIAVNALRTSVEGDDALDVNLSNNQISTATLASGFLTASASHTFVGGSFDLSFNQIASLESNSLADFNPAALYLHDNNIATIDNAVFSDMSALVTLNLANNQMNSLATGMLNGLSATDIDLTHNNITTLPINLLINHTNPAAITAFDLSGNTITDWNITTVNWVAGDNNSYTLAIDHALPQDINIDLSSPYDLDTNTITISKGETVSTAVQWTPQLSDDEVYIQPLTNVINITVLGGYIDIPILGIPSVVCMRTEVIRDLLTAALNQTDCTNTTTADLLALTGSLNWGNQNISQLTANDLRDLQGIHTFIKSNNSIVTLVDDLFSSNAPTTIDFSGNAIDTIAVNALRTSVEGDDALDVNLSNNQISTATLASGFLTSPASHTFIGGSFDLSDNQITTLAVASFADFNPASLYLHNNSIATIEDNALAAATGLQTLNLANNQLATVTESTLSGLSGLITLDLSNNALANMSDNALLDLSSLVTLNLTNNQLSTITAATFNSLAATAIDLSNNNIASLPINLLINHTNPAAITAFDLSGNTVQSWQITQANWTKSDNDTSQLVLPHALPMDITVSLSSQTGTLNPNVITILSGDTDSQVVTWTGDANSALEIIPAQSELNITVLGGYVTLSGISEAPSFTGSIDNQTIIVDHTFTPITLPTATGGDGALSYSLRETNGTNLPASLVFDPSTRMLSGSVDTAGNYSLTYSVQDAEGDIASMPFTLAVLPNLQPEFPAADDLIFAVVEDEAVNLTLPAASEGNGAVTYTLNSLDDLPAGLSFNATERSISGTTNATGDYSFSYTASDSADDDSVSLNIIMAVEAQENPVFNATEIFDNVTMRQDDAQFQIELPIASGGNGELSYSFSTNGTAGLPAGLVFNTTSLMIEGQPEVFGAFNITVTVDDADITDINDSTSFSFTLTLLESLGFATDLPATYSIVSGASVVITLPAGQGGVPGYTYALDSPLPTGLSFDNATREISGSTDSSGDHNITYRVTDSAAVSYTQQTALVVALLAPAFLASISDIEVQLGQSINLTLPAVDTDGQVDITYSISDAPAGILFNAATRQLTGAPTELGTHTITYSAIDTANQPVEQSFDITVTTNRAVLQDIMWRQALAIADQTVNSVKKRFALVNQKRLPFTQETSNNGTENIGANFQITETNWLGLWLNSGSGSLANQDSSYNWDGSTGVTQIGVDFSGKDYLVGLTSESVSTSSSFTVTGDAFDYTGNLDVSGLGLLSFYGGYYQLKYSVWAITSSGSGSADLSITAEGESSTLSSGVDYSMSAFGGSYKLADIFDVGFEGITSAALDFSDNTISSVSSNAASRNKFFGSIDFGKWTNKSASQSTAKSFSWSPKLALALRSDSGEGSSSSGLETTVSVQLEYSMLNFEFGTRNFASGDFSESGQWLSFNLIPTGKTGLNFTHRQQFGNSGSAENALLSDAALTDIVAGMRQDDTVTSISTIAYGWNVKAGSLQLYSKGESSYADSTAENLFQTKADIKWEHIGLSFDSSTQKYSWNAEVDPTAISFKAKIRF